MKKLFLLVFIFLVSANQAIAQTGGGSGLSGGGGSGRAGGGGSGLSGCETGFLCNPLKTNSIIGLFNSLLDVIMVLAMPVIVIFIILAGFKYVTAQGDTYKVKQAHQALLYAVIGGVLILGAQLIMYVITNTINAF